MRFVFGRFVVKHGAWVYFKKKKNKYKVLNRSTPGMILPTAIAARFSTVLRCCCLLPVYGLLKSNNVNIVSQVLFCLGKQVASPGKIIVRLHNHPESLLALKLLKASWIGNLFLT